MFLVVSWSEIHFDFVLPSFGVPQIDAQVKLCARRIERVEVKFVQAWLINALSEKNIWKSHKLREFG